MKKENYYGEVFRLFREAKGFTQKEAAGDDVSRGLLSDFEHGNHSISVDKFFNVLQNINVNAFEFQFAYNNYLESKDILLFNLNISDAYLRPNITKLKNILKELEKAIAQTPNKKKFLLDKIAVESILSIIDPSYLIPINDIHFLKNYFLTIKEWGLFDVTLLGYCTTIFDISTLYTLIEHMVSPTQQSIRIHYVKKSMIGTILNAVSVFIENNQTNLANNLLDYLDEIKIHEYDIYEKITFVYNRAMCEYKDGKISEIDTLKHCLEIMEFLDCAGTANLMREEISIIQKSH